MPFPPAPSTYRCADCGWHKTVIPPGDALLRGHTWFDQCPQCGSKQITQTPASKLAVWSARLRGR